MKYFWVVFAIFFTHSSVVQAMLSEGSHPDDPWEPFNRKMFAINDTLDEYILKPVAIGYRKVTPDFVDHSVTNFFKNIEDVYTVGNSLLQLKPHKAAMHTARIMFNTTFGLGGLIDVGTAFQIERNREDLGQTLGYWGVPKGPYLVLPLMGPSLIRHATGTLTEQFAFSLLAVFVADNPRYGLIALNIIDKRADVIPAEALIIGDKYSFVRNAFFQLREYEVKDGVVEDAFSSGDDESYLENF
ncbi:MAG: VacJ family lipoprotein [Hahellaceae bacterium]|nr:VacJ family lipoprotein [Hahellaceae bacterium]MCP5212173.1 VacJ family lipoprotein [Hahellaceae bacterium]